MAVSNEAIRNLGVDQKFGDLILWASVLVAFILSNSAFCRCSQRGERIYNTMRPATERSFFFMAASRAGRTFRVPLGSSSPRMLALLEG